MALRFTSEKARNAASRSRGDAFLEEIFDQHAKDLLGYLKAIMPDEHSAEDALQEALIRAARHRRKVQRAGNARSYLFRIARNEAFRLLGREKKRQEGNEELAGSPLIVPKQNATERAADIEELDVALRSLPGDQREIVVLKCIQGFTFAEISDLLDIPQDTAASRYRYGVEKLRHFMESGDEHAGS